MNRLFTETSIHFEFALDSLSTRFRLVARGVPARILESDDRKLTQTVTATVLARDYYVN